MKLTFSKIFIIGVLSILCFNIVVKCSEAALVKVECHSKECESEEKSNTATDCSHCITLKNIIIENSLISNDTNPQQLIFIPSANNYHFLNHSLIYHPPKV